MLSLYIYLLRRDWTLYLYCLGVEFVYLSPENGLNPIFVFSRCWVCIFISWERIERVPRWNFENLADPSSVHLCNLYLFKISPFHRFKRIRHLIFFYFFKKIWVIWETLHFWTLQRKSANIHAKNAQIHALYLILCSF